MITFSKFPPTDKLLWAFNNNVIKYRDPYIISPEWSDINCGLFSVRLYPDPEGFFTFNFLEYVRKVIVKNNFADDLQTHITGNTNSLIYDNTDNVYLELTANIRVSNTDVVGDAIELPLKFIAGVLQLEEYKTGETYQEGLFLLLPPKAGSKTNYKLNYWPGYPFDVSVFTSSPGVLSLFNMTNNIGVSLVINGTPTPHVSRIAFSDGSHDETIEDHLPLSIGNNIVRIRKHQLPQPEALLVTIEKHHPRDGVYIKYRNQFGGWSYWLFHKQHNRSRNTKDGEELENDWNDLADTMSPTIQTGVESSRDTLKCLTERIDMDDVRQLEQIIESPKIYLYTADRYSQGRGFSLSQFTTPLPQRWIEVKCGTKRLDITQPKRNRYSFFIEFILPERYKISLL